MVLEAGVLKTVGDHYEMAESRPELTIPATLHDSLMARLDRMEGGAKKVAQIGACIGREFSFSLSKAVLRGAEGAWKKAWEPWSRPSSSSPRGRIRTDQSFTFKHALIQDAAYESLLKRTRQEYHERIALALEHDFPDMRESQPERLAQHYTRAARPDKAIPYWLAAGQRGGRQLGEPGGGEPPQGRAQAHRGPRRPRSSDRARRWTSSPPSGPPSSALQGYSSAEVEKTYARARELCEEIGATPQHFWVLWGLWAFHLVRGEHDQAVTFGADDDGARGRTRTTSRCSSRPTSPWASASSSWGTSRPPARTWSARSRSTTRRSTTRTPTSPSRTWGSRRARWRRCACGTWARPTSPWSGAGRPWSWRIGSGTRSRRPTRWAARPGSTSTSATRRGRSSTPARRSSSPPSRASSGGRSGERSSAAGPWSTAASRRTRWPR